MLMAHLLGVDNTFATPVADPSAGTRGRHCDALGHKIPGRAQRPARRCTGGAGPATFRPAVFHSERHRRGAGSILQLPAQPWPEDTGPARARSKRNRSAARPVVGCRFSRRASACIRGCPPTRDTMAQPADGRRLWRHAQLRDQRRISPRPNERWSRRSCFSWPSVWGPWSR